MPRLRAEDLFKCAKILGMDLDAKPKSMDEAMNNLQPLLQLPPCDVVNVDMLAGVDNIMQLSLVEVQRRMYRRDFNAYLDEQLVEHGQNEGLRTLLVALKCRTPNFHSLRIQDWDKLEYAVNFVIKAAMKEESNRLAEELSAELAKHVSMGGPDVLPETEENTEGAAVAGV